MFQRLIESVRDYAIFLLDPDGHVTTWNVGAQRIKGYQTAEILGQHFSAFYPEEDVRAGKCTCALSVAADEGRFEDEGWRVRKDGSRFWANVVISVVRDPEGELLGFSKVTRDLTERKRLEQERAERIASESIRRVKDDLFAMLGHELRNPLAPIVAALQLIEASQSMSREHAIIDRHVKHMIRLVDDLMHISQLTHGELTLETMSFDLRDAVTDAVEVARPLLDQREHTLELQVPSGPLSISGDRSRLVHAFAKIISNAAKYTDRHGRIAVTVTSSDGEALIEVRDNGRGIEASLIPRVFDDFVQGPQGLDRPTGGLGLGLAFVHMLIHMHGGTVKAESPRLGEGSTFTVRLPLQVAEVASRSETPQPEVAREPALRVLVVDDNEDAASLLGAILERAGHRVEVSSDPAAALRMAETFRPELAVLDIGLPSMDGYALAKCLRAALAPGLLRVIALTGYGQASDRERSRAAGFEAHLVKPVVAKELLDTIGALAGR